MRPPGITVDNKENGASGIRSQREWLLEGLGNFKDEVSAEKDLVLWLQDRQEVGRILYKILCNIFKKSCTPNWQGCTVMANDFKAQG